MAKIVEGLVDKHMPLMGESITIDEHQIEDYVLVFSNPFDVADYTVSEFTDKIPADEVKIQFLRLFRVSSDELLLQEFIQEIDQLIQSSGVVLAKDIAQIAMKAIFKLLQDFLGFLIKPYLSADKDQIFILLKASEHNLKVQADLTDYKLQFNEESSDVDKFNLKPYQAVLPYGAFEKGGSSKKQGSILDTDKEGLFKRYDSEGNPASEGELFRFNDRVRLVYSMISSTLEVGELKSFELLIGDFPLHSQPALNQLKTEWSDWHKVFKPQPFEKIREYYGEKLTMYFIWLQYYIYWLMLPSFFGTVLAIILFASGGVHSDGLISSVCLLLFSLLLGISSTVFDQLWLRKENTLAWLWGLSDFELTEEQRPEHQGKYGKDEVSGKMKKLHEPKGLEKYAQLMGYGVILFFVGLVVAAIAAIFAFRALGSDPLHTVLPGVVNAIQIKILNYVYRLVAKKLTDWENHETESNYVDSLTFKLFCFQFVNSYASLFYIAFVKGSTSQGCADHDCMAELQTQLGSIFITNLFLNIIEIGIPLVSIRLKMNKEMKRAEMNGKKLTEEEIEALKAVYDNPLEDYMEMVISYGYIVLFGVAFPFVPIMALFLALLEVRVDAWKLNFLTRRPFPSQDNSIGIWISIIQTVSYVGAAVNIGIVLFTANSFEIQDASSKWIFFLVIEHGIFVLKFLLSAYIPDVSELVKDGLVWSERVMNEKLYGKLSDTDKERAMRNLRFDTTNVIEVKVENILNASS